MQAVVEQIENVQYAWKANSRIPVKPEIAAQELKAVAAQHGGTVKPEQVVERARPEDSHLHDVFEWDDSEAARIHREDQARHLMRSLVVVYRKESGELTQPLRFMAIKLTRSSADPAEDDVAEQATEPRVYLPMRRVMDEQDLRERLLRQAFRDLQNWRNRYKDIAEFAEIFRQIDRLEKKIA